MKGISGSQVGLVAVLATLANLLPMWLASPGADVLFHYALIECFARQLWQGDWYPRWCMAANDGLGSPVFLFYFPLPYYITSLFYPLHLTTENLYALSVSLATLVTFFTCRAWLGDMVSPGCALLGAALFLFLPYRMEVMYFRTALAELWCMAFLPLVFLYTRHIMRGQARDWLPLSIATLMALLSHVAATCIVLAACAVQLLFAKFSLRMWLAFFAALEVAAMTAAFYLVPAHYFTAYLHPDALEFMRSVWVNNYLSLGDGMARVSVMVGLLVTILLSLMMALVVTFNRGRIDLIAARELRGWLAVMTLSLFLMTAASAPLWNWFYSITGIMTPWRAQVILPFAIVWLAVSKMQWLMSDKQMKTWRWDYGALMSLLFLLSLTMLTMRPPEVESLYKVAMDSMVINAPEYRTRWTDKEYADRENIIARYERDKGLRWQPHLLKGEGTARLLEWDSRQMVIGAAAAQPSTFVLQHMYFPIWDVTLDGQPANILFVHPHTGYMLLEVPVGRHRVEIRRDLAYAIGLPFTAAVFASFLGWTILVISTMRYRRRRAGRAIFYHK